METRANLDEEPHIVMEEEVSTQADAVIHLMNWEPPRLANAMKAMHSHVVGRPLPELERPKKRHHKGCKPTAADEKDVIQAYRCPCCSHDYMVWKDMASLVQEMMRWPALECPQCMTTKGAKTTSTRADPSSPYFQSYQVLWIPLVTVV